MSETVLRIALAKQTMVRLICGRCGKEAKMPLIKVSSQMEKCRFCGARTFDDLQVDAVHALVDAAKEIVRGKRAAIEVMISVKG
jgi:hypothetical protein